jgi:DNA/RNA-binding domain of Phe-tRNA-synthetase-like protein
MSLKLTIDAGIMESCPDCHLGYLVIRGVSITGSSAALSQEFFKLQDEVAKVYKINSLAKLPRIMAIRNMYKKLEFDPSRYRPASEALVRRVLQHKGVYYVNSAVDASNYCSLKYLIPFGLYDLDNIEGDIQYRRAEHGSYENIGGNHVSTERKPFLTDAAGVFGNPTSDARRTAVSLSTTNMLSVAYAGGDTDRSELEEILQFAGEILTRYNGGSVEEMNMVGA